MVLPLLIWGGVAAVSALSGATYFGLANQEPDKITNNSFQDNYQQDYITNETIFDFSESYFEEGSKIDLSNITDIETSKSSNQENAQIGKKVNDKTILYLGIGASVIGAYFIYRRLK